MLYTLLKTESTELHMMAQKIKTPATLSMHQQESFLEESKKVNIHLQVSEVPKVFTCTATSSSTPQKYIVQKNWRSNFTPKNLEKNNFS